MERQEHFHEWLATGRLSESRIARWLIEMEHWNILPAYEIEMPTGKGPRLFTPQGQLIVPDLLALKLHEKECLLAWYETKHKTRFSWYRRARSWQTGIAVRHSLDSLQVQEQTQWDVSLCFFHERSDPSPQDLSSGSPLRCPTGLYRQSLRVLMQQEDHRGVFLRDGRHYQMVYWNERNAGADCYDRRSPQARGTTMSGLASRGTSKEMLVKQRVWRGRRSTSSPAPVMALIAGKEGECSQVLPPAKKAFVWLSRPLTAQSWTGERTASPCAASVPFSRAWC